MWSQMGVEVMLDEFNIIKRKKKKNAFVSTALLITIAIAIPTGVSRGLHVPKPGK